MFEDTAIFAVGNMGLSANHLQPENMVRVMNNAIPKTMIFLIKLTSPKNFSSSLLPFYPFTLPPFHLSLKFNQVRSQKDNELRLAVCSASQDEQFPQEGNFAQNRNPADIFNILTSDESTDNQCLST